MPLKSPGIHVGGARAYSLLLVLAVWFGLVTGLVEGAARLAMQQLGWLAWQVAFVGVTQEIIWIAALFGAILFVAVGVGWVAIQELFGVKVTGPAVFSFAFLMSLDWLLLPGRFRTWGSLVLALGLATVFARFYHRSEGLMERFFRRSLSWVVAITLLSFAGIEGGTWGYEALTVGQRAPAASGAPNILIVLLDALRADHLSGLGYARETSPYMDHLMSEGVVFENGIATSSWTLPSHASLLTGRYPFDHGGNHDFDYAASKYTLGEALQKLGYRTGAFSSNRHFFTRRIGFRRGFDHFVDFYTTVQDALWRTVLGHAILRRVRSAFPQWVPPIDAAEISHQALRWIRRDNQRPYFVFINYYGTHSPYMPPQPYASMFQDSPPGLHITAPDPRYGPRGTENSAPPDKIRDNVNRYDGAIRNIDDHVKQLLAELLPLSPHRGTLVLITSDHGETFGEHGLTGHKASLYWESIHVPLIVWWPGHVPADRRIQHPVSIAAVPATLMDLLGEGPKNEFPVKSVAPLWQEPSSGQGTGYPLSEIAQYPFSQKKGTPVFFGAIASLVSDKWHYIQHEKFGAELYDWKNDPHEEHNLAHTPEGQEVCALFSKRLANLRGESATARSR